MATDNALPSGHALPGYNILDRVGQGGMSVVYRARHDVLNRTVAIKFLTAELSKIEEDRQAFKFETQAAARINHPNVVQLFDAGEVSNRPYYVMEYVSGANLGELISMRGKMEEEDALLIAEKIAEALRHCWLEHRLIHCDVKPENLIVDMHGKVKLTDLGLARIDGLTSGVEDSDLTVGTPAYMSPEQAMGVSDLDLRTDIYALGALLYHMVTGYRLFEGESDAETAQSQVTYAVEDVVDVNPGISHAFAWMIERMLVKDRDHRYASWEEVLTDITCVKTKSMIKGGVFEEDLSTMARSEQREVPPPSKGNNIPASAGAARSPTPNTANDPRKIRISKDRLSQAQIPALKSAGSKKPAVYDAGKAFMSMLVVAAITVVLYGLTYGKLQLDLNKKLPEPTVSSRPANAPYQPKVAETRLVDANEFENTRYDDQSGSIKVPETLGSYDSSSEDYDEPEPVMQPTVAPRPTALPVASAPLANDPFAAPANDPFAATQAAAGKDAAAWNNPDFNKAVKALEVSQQRYDEYLKNRGDARILDAIEKNCQAAIKIFDSLKGQAPAGVDLGSYSKKAYTLLANCQWTKQLL